MQQFHVFTWWLGKWSWIKHAIFEHHKSTSNYTSYRCRTLINKISFNSSTNTKLHSGCTFSVILSWSELSHMHTHASTHIRLHACTRVYTHTYVHTHTHKCQERIKRSEHNRSAQCHSKGLLNLTASQEGTAQGKKKINAGRCSYSFVVDLVEKTCWHPGGKVYAKVKCHSLLEHVHNHHACSPCMATCSLGYNLHFLTGKQTVNLFIMHWPWPVFTEPWYCTCSLGCDHRICSQGHDHCICSLSHNHCTCSDVQIQGSPNHQQDAHNECSCK